MFPHLGVILNYSGSLAVNIFTENVFVPLPRIRGIIRDVIHRNVFVVISRQWAEEQVLLSIGRPHIEFR